MVTSRLGEESEVPFRKMKEKPWIVWSLRGVTGDNIGKTADY